MGTLTLTDFAEDVDCKLRKIGTCEGGKTIWYCPACGFNRFAAKRGEKVECAVKLAAAAANRRL